MEPLLSALRALTNTVHSGEGEGEDEGGEETVLVGADRLVLGLLSTVRVSSVSLAVRHHEEESLGLSLTSITSLFSTSRTVTSKSSISPGIKRQTVELQGSGEDHS